VVNVEAQRSSNEEAATQIAHTFEEWIHLVEHAQNAQASVLNELLIRPTEQE
jgi:hypothetical protein